MATWCCRSAGWFWESHGHYSEGRRWLEEALAQDDRASMAARVKALDRLSGWCRIRTLIEQKRSPKKASS